MVVDWFEDWKYEVWEVRIGPWWYGMITVWIRVIWCNFWILDYFTHPICYFYGEFWGPNLKKCSSWKLFPTSLSISYFNLGIFGNHLKPFGSPSLDRNKTARFTVHPTSGSVRIFINFFKPIFKILPSQILLGTFGFITYKYFNDFQSDLDTGWFVFWWPEGLFERTGFRLSLSVKTRYLRLELGFTFFTKKCSLRCFV